MGIEYKICIDPMSRERIEVCIRNLDAFVAYDPATGLYHLSCHDKSDDPLRPDASLAIEAAGIYFCDHLSGESHQLFEALLQLLNADFDIVSIEEL